MLYNFFWFNYALVRCENIDMSLSSNKLRTELIRPTT